MSDSDFSQFHNVVADVTWSFVVNSCEDDKNGVSSEIDKWATVDPSGFWLRQGINIIRLPVRVPFLP